MKTVGGGTGGVGSCLGTGAGPWFLFFPPAAGGGLSHEDVGLLHGCCEVGEPIIVGRQTIHFSQLPPLVEIF